MTLTIEQKDLLFGTLLGDGNLLTETSGRTWRYRALHKALHKDYLFHKYDQLKNLCGSPPIFSEIDDPRTNKRYQRYYFNTLTQDSLRFFGNMFYVYDIKQQRWVKNVPVPLETFLTPRAIAYWYMDDGAIKWLNNSNAMRICTESFSEGDVIRLRNALSSLYNINTTQTQKTNNGVFVGYRISIPEKSSAAFRDLIQPYLVECMKYKVSDGNRGHL